MDGQDFRQKETKKKRESLTPFFIDCGGAGYRHLVLPAISKMDYTFRSRFFIPSEIDGSYFDIVTNNCVEFTCNKVAL